MSRVPIVNEQDELIGYKDRESLENKEIYRVSALWITNSQGQILLAQRSFSKVKHPGQWGPAVAGTVEEGENYDQNIIREAEEELGIVGMEFKKVNKLRIYTTYNYFVQWYRLVLDRNVDEFRIQKEEVEKVKWFDREELKKELEDNPNNYLHSMEDYLRIFK